MNQSYKATLSQYALPQFLPIWGGKGGVEYTYCANNPMRYVDPTGKTLEEGDGDPPPGMSKNMWVLQQNQNTTPSIFATNSGEDGTAKNSSQKPSSSSPSKPTQSSGTGQATMKDFYRQQLKEATGLDKNMEYAIRYAAESMGLPSEKEVINAVAPVLKGGVLLYPLVGFANDVKTLFTGEDMYDNKASTGERILAGVSVVTFGVGNTVKRGVGTIASNVNKVLNIRTAVRTTKQEYEKK